MSKGNDVKNRSNKKDVIHPSTVKELKSFMNVEYSLYHFIKQRFYNIVKNIHEKKIYITTPYIKRSKSTMNKLSELLASLGGNPKCLTCFHRFDKI